MRLAPVKIVARLALALLVVWTIYFLRANVWFRLYPAVMVAFALTAFAVSLRRTPLIEVFARRMGENLDARGVAYCRKVTCVWVAFLSAHLAVTLTTVLAPYPVWAWYNGCVAYVLMGLLLAGEWLYRRRARRG